MQAVSFAAPLGAAIAMRRSPRRDVAVCALQMWAYLAAYKTPHDDEEAQRARVLISYPIRLDRLIGLGELPSTRLQRALARNGPGGPDGAEWTALDRVLVWAHWSWFAVPHGALLYLMWRAPERFGRAAVLTYAVFDIGASFYWFVPTAPPWYAAGAREDGAPLAAARGAAHDGRVRRGLLARPLGLSLQCFGGNPLAAMPSLHFATTLMAALLLAEVGPIAGAVGFAYTATLGFALVYLGEHYVVDLLAGAALTVAVTAFRGLGGAGP